jgi:hypothetical protein
MSGPKPACSSKACEQRCVTDAGIFRLNIDVLALSLPFIIRAV